MICSPLRQRCESLRCHTAAEIHRSFTTIRPTRVHAGRIAVVAAAVEVARPLPVTATPGLLG